MGCCCVYTQSLTVETRRVARAPALDGNSVHHDKQKKEGGKADPYMIVGNTTVF
jgi:hypothetical protein